MRSELGLAKYPCVTAPFGSAEGCWLLREATGLIVKTFSYDDRRKMLNKDEVADTNRGELATEIFNAKVAIY